MKEISAMMPLVQGVGENSPNFHRSNVIAGLRSLGINTIDIPYGFKPKTKHVICWAWHKGRELRAAGHEVLVMERSYIGDRFKYTSLGWNGLNGHAEFPEYASDGGKRFGVLGGEMKPWKPAGEGAYILIMGQVKNDASLQGLDINSWYKKMAYAAHQIYGLPVYFRPHPEAARRGGYHSVAGLPNLAGALKDAINGALFTIAYNSNSCLDSILQGVPCYAGDKGTMAWDLCMRGLNEIVQPHRQLVIDRIAHSQWSPEEIYSGEPLRKLIEMKS